MEPVDKFIAMLNSTTGRDKLCRWVQYFSKFAAGLLINSMLFGQGKNKALAAKISALSANMSLTRKVLRFGRPISVFKDLMAKLDNGEVAGFGAFRFLGSLFLGLYFLSDHLVYFQKIGRPLPPTQPRTQEVRR